MVVATAAAAELMLFSAAVVSVAMITTAHHGSTCSVRSVLIRFVLCRDVL